MQTQIRLLLQKQSDQGLPCLQAIWSGSSLFAILTSILWNNIFENRKRKVFNILEHLPYDLFSRRLCFSEYYHCVQCLFPQNCLSNNTCRTGTYGATCEKCLRKESSQNGMTTVHGYTISQRFYHVEAHQKNGELRDIWTSYFTFQIVNNKGTDQTACMRRLVCTFVLRKQQSQGFSCRGPYDVEAKASWLRARLLCSRLW